MMRIATQEEEPAYEENFMCEEEERVMYQRCFASKVETNTWYVLFKQLLLS